MNKQLPVKPGGLPVELISSYASLLTNVVTAYFEYARVREIEHTKRQQIVTEGQFAIARLVAQQTAFTEFITNSFEERKYVIDQLFRRIDEDLAKEDTANLECYLAAIVGILKTDPNHGFLQFCEQLDDKDAALTI